MFTWKIFWTETGEIAIKTGYAYPHTAFAGVKAYVKDAIRYRERHDLEPLIVTVLEGDAEDAQLNRGTVMRTFDGTCKEFLEGRKK